MMRGVLLAEVLLRPPFAVGLIGVAVGLVVLTAVWTARRERARWTLLLRLAALAGLGWLLLGPSASEPGRPSNAERPRLAVLVDTSASMAQMDGAASADAPPVSRLEAVRRAWLGDEVLARLRAVADVRVLAFDERARPALIRQLEAEGDQTRLYDALNQIDADAALILSDGHDTTGSGAAALARGPATPSRVYAAPVGASRSAPDVALQAWTASDRLYEDQPTTIAAALFQRGLAGRPAIVELLHNGEVVEQRPLTLADASAELAFEVSPPLAPGITVEAHQYTVRIRLPGYDESYTDNNAEDIFIQVSRGRVRVLLLEGEPYWDTRSLSRLIGAHPRFDLTAVYGFGDQRRSRVLGETLEHGTDPVQALSRFDIVVLGRRVERLVDAGFADRLTAFVRGGGALVLAHGRPFDPADNHGRSLLAGIEPVSPVAWAEPVLGEMRVRLGDGDEGRGPLADLREGEVLSRLPGMLAATRIDGRKAASVVMLEQQPGDRAADTPAMAALTTMRVGSGVVMAVLTEGLWRWELLPASKRDALAESVYGSFWVRALQWLASGGAFLPGQDIAIEADRLGVEPGQAVTLTISTRYIETDALDLQLSATDQAGNIRPVPLETTGTSGGYRASFTPDQPGVYAFALRAPGRADLIDPANPLTTHIVAVERSVESRDTSARPEVLKQLTEPTGGRCLALDEPEPVIDYLQTLHELRLAQDRVDYDFNRWPVFVWIAGCFGLEWVLRRRSGLR